MAYVMNEIKIWLVSVTGREDWLRLCSPEKLYWEMTFELRHDDRKESAVNWSKHLGWGKVECENNFGILEIGL